jgi:hypothetical protein
VRLAKAYEIQGFAILDLAGSCQFSVNDVGTCAKIDTPVTRECSRFGSRHGGALAPSTTFHKSA